MSDLVLYDQHDGICRITLNRPAKHNCIDLPMLHQLDSAIARAEQESGVKVLILSGAGKMAFSSGADLKAFAALETKDISAWIHLGNAVINRLALLPKPTIAAVNGYAYGGGLELALACDFRFASAAAKFCSPELKRGWIPGWGGIMRLRDLLGEARAKEVVFLGDVLDGNEAFRIGLVTRLVPTESFDERLAEFVHQVAALDRKSFTAAKEHLTSSVVSSTDVEFQVAATVMARLMELMETS